MPIRSGTTILPKLSTEGVIFRHKKEDAGLQCKKTID